MTVQDSITAIVDEAHEENLGGEHRSGFCKACAAAYLVAQTAASLYVGDDWPKRSDEIITVPLNG